MFRLLFFLIYELISVFSLNKSAYIALYQKNIDVLENKLLDISNPLSNNYGKWMTKKEISEIVNPPVEDQIKVIKWLRENHVEDIKNFGDSIHISADKDILKRVFKINNSYSSHLFNYSIPKSLKNIIEFIEMDSKHVTKDLKKNVNSKTADDRFFGRESLLHLYNVSEFSSNDGVSGASIEYQHSGGFLSTDLILQQQNNSQKINNKTQLKGDNTGVSVESQLDIQLMSQSGNGINLWFWESSKWLYSFATDFFNTDIVPDIISMSWGWAEDRQCDIIDCQNITSQQYVNRVNNEYLKITLRGVTIVVSSGDAGAPGRTNELCDTERPINPVFPGSSPYILSVGATFVPNDNSTLNFTSPLCMDNNCITSINEKSIQYDDVKWTAGGGFDLYQNNTPPWQYKSVNNYLNSGIKLPNTSNFNINGRAYPDVSAIGHSCPTFIDGLLGGVDGTSCSSPVVAGLLSYVNKWLLDNKKTKAGFINPLLYYLQDNCENCFRDITDGYNWCTEDQCCDNKTDYGFSAAKGYDPVSGLGTLNIGSILDYLEQTLYV